MGAINPICVTRESDESRGGRPRPPPSAQGIWNEGSRISHSQDRRGSAAVAAQPRGEGGISILIRSVLTRAREDLRRAVENLFFSYDQIKFILM
jgi:hypothetical protein